MNDKELAVDPVRAARTELGDAYTGIYVRAKMPDGRWQSVDISWLDAPSLLVWLRSRGGKNEWAENTVGLLLGHIDPLVVEGAE